MKKRHIESATKILKDMKYMTIATVCSDGSPWNTPVAPTPSKDLIFRWGSNENSVHSQNIRKEKRVFVVIFDSHAEEGTGEGVLPSKYSGRWRNNADEVLAKLFCGVRKCGTLSQDLLSLYSSQKVYSFCKKRILQNFGSFVFKFGSRKWKRRGLGRNFPFAPLFVLGEFGADIMSTLYGSLE